MSLEIGQQAPEIELPDQDGNIHRLSDYKGKWVLVYFYPEDDTPGCTTEACSLRDNLPHFQDTDAIVLGVSVDSVESHEKFAEKHGLPFTLLSDSEKKTVRDYGVWVGKNNFGKDIGVTMRTSFLIDPHGKIAKIYEKVKPEIHAEQVLKDLQEAQHVGSS